MESIKEQIYDRVEKMYHQRVGISRIQATLAKTLNQEVPKELIYDIIEEIKKGKKEVDDIYKSIEGISGIDEPSSKKKERADGGLKEIVADMGDDKKYDYFPETGHLVIYPEGQPKSLLLSTLEAIIESFSKDGKNMSAKQIMIDFQLTPKVRHYLKNTFNIYKDSTPFDPITLQSFNSEEDMEKSAKEKAERLTEGKMKRIYDDAERRFKDNAFSKFAKANMGYDIFLEKLERAIKLYIPREVNISNIPPIDNNLTKSVIFGDAHLGKKGTDGIVIRIKKMTNELINSPEKNIDITFLGDIGECFVPFPNSMHPDQRLGMESINTEDLVMLAVDVLENMLISLYKSGKTITFNGLGGNHGRLTEKKEFDPYRSAEMIIYRFLQKIVEDTSIKINILRENINIIKSGNVKFVFLHGDELTPAKLQRIAMQELEDKYFLCICSADKHHLKITEISDRITWIQSPSLSGKGRFDENLALSSLSGYIELTKNNDGLVDINVKRLK